MEGLAGAASVIVAPDGHYVYAVGAHDGAVVIFQRDQATGMLTFQQTVADGAGGVDGLYEAFGIAIAPDGGSVHVVAAGDNALTSFRRDPADGSLIYLETLANGATAGTDGLGDVSGIIVSPDGKFVYAAGAADDAVAIFQRDVLSGHVAFVRAVYGGMGDGLGLHGVRSLAISPDGKYLYAACGELGSNGVSVYSRDLDTGDLVFLDLLNSVDGVQGLFGASSVVVSPDGLHVYVGGQSSSTVVAFSRDGTTGLLTFVGLVQDGVGGVTGLNETTSVIISPDGKNVYACGEFGSSVAVFNRDAATGVLTFSQVLKDGVGGVLGLGGVRTLAISLDGTAVYAAGQWDNAVTVLRRDPATGQLLLLQVLQDGVGGVTGLADVAWVSVSPNGAHVYAAAEDTGAVTVFDRDAVTGQLTLVQVLDNAVGGPPNAAIGHVAIAASPDNKHVYAVGSGKGVLVSLGRPNAAPVLKAGAAMSLAPVVEDQTDPPGTLVRTILGQNFSDADGDPPGIAVIAVDSTHSQWQYSIDGGTTWSPFGAVSEESARLLAGGALSRIRFIPATDFFGTIASGMTFRAWDGTTGLNGESASATPNDGSSAFSSAATSASITVTAVNDAPVLDSTGVMTLAAISEDGASSPGTLVSAMVASAGGDPITDADGGLEGIAVVAAGTTHGLWQYTTDAGAHWTALGIPTPTSARLLAADTGTKIRFVPVNHFSGTVTAGITFRAWDQTSGKNGGTANAATAGGLTAFSNAVGTADITVDPVNDPPVASSQQVTLAAGGSVEVVLTGSDVETPSGNLIFGLASGPLHGTLTTVAPNRYRYDADPDFAGIDRFFYTATDDGDPAGSHADPGDLTSLPAAVNLLVGEPRHLVSGATVKYTDASNGKVIAVSLQGPGSADLVFAHAEPCDLGAIALRDTTAASTLTFIVPSGFLTPAGGVVVTGSLGSLAAAGVRLSSLLTIDGTAGTLTLGDVTGAAIDIGGTPTSKPATLKFGTVKDTGIVSDMPLTSLTATEWLDTDGTLQEIKAPWIGTLAITGKATARPRIAGDIAANLTLTGLGVTKTSKTLATATIKGSVAGSLWAVTGLVGTVTITGTVGDVAAPWQLTGPSTVGTLTLGDVTSADVTVGGLGAIKAIRWLDGSIQAAKITSITTMGVAGTKTVQAIPGDWGADVTLSGLGVTGTAKTLGSASIKGNVGVSIWDLTGPVGTLAITGTVGTVAQPWRLIHPTSLGGLTFGDVTNAEVTINGGSGAIKAKRWLAGSIQAVRASSIAATGVAASLANPGMSGDFAADVTVTGTVKTTLAMSIAGWLDGATILSTAGPVGTLTVGGIRDSRIRAGDASVHTSLGGLMVRGIKGQTYSFINSNISAWTMGTVTLRDVLTDNAGHTPQAFGVQAHTVATYSRYEGKAVAKKGSKLTGPAPTFDPVGDYSVQLV